MNVKFVKSVPKKRASLQIDLAVAERLIDQLVTRPGEWAEVRFLELYPNHSGSDEKTMKRGLYNLAARIKRGGRPFHEYEFEAQSRGVSLFIRVKADIEYVESA